MLRIILMYIDISCSTVFTWMTDFIFDIKSLWCCIGNKFSYRHPQYHEKGMSVYALHKFREKLFVYVQYMF